MSALAPVLRLTRFARVGIANTLLTFGVITLMLAAGFGDFAANAVGYAAGLTLSYFANRRWTFAATGRPNVPEFLAYLACFSVAYTANLAVLAVVRALGFSGNPFAHLPGMAAYTLLFFTLANWFAFAPSQPIERILTALRPRVSELALLLFALVTFLAIAGVALTHDVAWQFWIARQLIGGARLYRDIWEVNPPLWFWSAIPVEMVAQAFHVSSRALLIAIIVIMGVISSMLFVHIAGIEKPWPRFSIMVAAFWLCVPMPLFDFGQREQFAAICGLPYAALIARRVEGRTIAWPLAAFVGLFAAYGFALKHYFVLVPLLLEAWMLLRLRRAWRPLRPETLLLGISAAAYAAAVLTLTPDYLSFMVPMISASYQGYNVPFIFQIDEVAQLVWLLAALALVRAGRVFGENGRPLTAVLVLMGLAYMAAYFAQQKGWQYHAIPVTVALLLAVVVRLTEETVATLPRHIVGQIAIGITFFFSIMFGSYHDFLRPGSEPIIKTIRRGDSVAALAADPMWIWPVADEYHLIWPMRLYSYWMLPAIGHAEVHGDGSPALARVIDQVHEQTLADLKCHPPAAVMIEIRRRYDYQPANFDVAAFFLRDPGLRAFLAAHYVEAPRRKFFRVFRRKGEVAPSGGAACRTVAPLKYPLPSSQKR